jgi:hypothetical protein
VLKTTRSYFWIALAVTTFSASAIAIYAAAKFSRGERIITQYCRETLAGDEIAGTRRRALGMGLIVKEKTATSADASGATVWPDDSWWSGASFCSLQHDGSRVTYVSFNPWYH